MERRALIAVVISLLILVLYQEVILKRFYPHPVEVPPGSVPAEPPLASGGADERVVSPVVAPEVKSDEAAAPAPLVGRDIVVETDLYRAVFTTAGARLKSLQLKHYRATVAPDSPPLELILDPVVSDLPLGIELRGAQRQAQSDAAVAYRVDRDAVAVTGGDTAALTFTGELEGAAVTKRISVRGDRYLFGIDVDLGGVPQGFSEMAIAWHEGLNVQGHEVIFDNVVALQGPKVRHETFANLEAGKTLENDIVWVAFSGKYFLAAMVPSVEPANAVRVWMKRRAHAAETQLLMPPGTFKTHLDMYLGPKDIDILEEANHSLRRAVDLGWFTFIALPMLHVLRFFHRFAGNFGVAIILLTVIVKVLFIPLTQKSLKSMRAMQKLQPQMAQIRERLKDKPEEMNKEIMELYRRHKVNPFGGCLPMVLQIPVFVGLYQALLNAVELRHAPFVGWIKDLSAPDRLGTMQLPFVQEPGIPVLTLVMGGSMFLQQWMTPAAGDPTQQRVMLIMPVMFTFMFINFPSGLTLYWLVNNVLTIAQQYAINRPEER